MSNGTTSDQETEARRSLAEMMTSQEDEASGDEPVDEDTGSTEEVAPKKRRAAPAYQQEMNARFERLEELVKTSAEGARSAQGQSRRLEAVVTQLLQTQQARSSDGGEADGLSDDELAELPESARRALRAAARDSRAARQAQVLSQQEQESRLGWLTWLRELAEELDVPWEDTAPQQFENLPGEQVALQGRKAVATASNRRKRVDPNDPAFRQEVAKEVEQRLREAGLYDEVMRTGRRAATKGPVAIEPLQREYKGNPMGLQRDERYQRWLEQQAKQDK